MVYLLADVSAAHTRLLLTPLLGHVDSKHSAALHGIENVLRQRKSSSPFDAFALA